MAAHHGSLIVSLIYAALGLLEDGQSVERTSAWRDHQMLGNTPAKKWVRPFLNQHTNGISTHPSIIGEVLNYLVLVEPAVISVMKALRKVPMVKGLRYWINAS